MSPGVHRQRTTDSSWNARKKLRRAQLPSNALARQLRTRQAGSCAYLVRLRTLEIAQDFGRRNNDAWDTAVANQQIATNAMPENRCVRIQLGQEIPEVVNACRHEEYFCRPARSPGCMAAHRLVITELALHGEVSCGGHHLCTISAGPLLRSSGRLAAYAPISPAPMVRTMSPS